MNKKILMPIIIISILIIIIICISFINISNQKIDIPQKSLTEDTNEYVDNTITSFIKSYKYRNADINKRIKYIETILDSFINSKYIADYHIYNECTPVRVEYTYIDKSSGCIFLSDYNDKYN